MVPTLAHSGEGQGKHLIEDYVLETQNSEQSHSQFLDVIAILPNMKDGRRNKISPGHTNI